MNTSNGSNTSFPNTSMSDFLFFSSDKRGKQNPASGPTDREKVPQLLLLGKEVFEVFEVFKTQERAK